MRQRFFLFLIACMLLFAGCGHTAEPIISTTTAPLESTQTQPPESEPTMETIVTALPTEAEPTDETEPVAETEPTVEVEPTDETEPVAETEPTVEVEPTNETEPSVEEPTIPYLYGDTTPTWNPELLSVFPADEECSEALLLEKWLAVEGLSLQDLEERDCRQLLLTVACKSDGVETINVCYEKQEDGTWTSVPELSWLPGHVGKYGIAHNRIIDSYTSPAGLWALGMAFGNSPEPDDLLLPWRDVTPESDWICDTVSPYFNTWQERDDPNLTERWDYDAGEHLADYPYSYAYACVIEFNTGSDSVPSRGCAIFLHCGEDYTAGCVSLPEHNLLAVLRWLDPDRNPYILITGNPQ